MATSKPRSVDLLADAFDLNQRRKFSVKNKEDEVILDLYFKPITRADRKKVNARASSDEAIEISTQMLVEKAELEDGSKAFAMADVAKLQRELPETILNDLELFLFGIDGNESLEEAKND